MSLDTDTVASCLEDIEDIYGYTTEQLAPCSLIEFDINEEDMELCIPGLLLDPDFEHPLSEVKKVTYNNDGNEERLLSSLGFEGAYKVYFKKGKPELYAWNYGDEKVTKIEYEPPKWKGNVEIAEKIKQLLLDGQYNGNDPFLSYHVRNKWLDTDIDGDCIVIVYRAQEALPRETFEEIRDLLKERLPEFGQIEIWLNASDRAGNDQVFQVV